MNFLAHSQPKDINSLVVKQRDLILINSSSDSYISRRSQLHWDRTHILTFRKLFNTDRKEAFLALAVQQTPLKLYK